MDVSQTLTRALHRASIEQLSEHTSISRRSLYRYRMGDIDPPLRRAAAIASALGYELVIRPRSAAAPEDQNPAISSRYRRVSNEAAAPSTPGPTPGPGPDTALGPPADRHIAEILIALADEYETLNARGRESLRIHFWATHPALAARAGPRLPAAGRREERPPPLRGGHEEPTAAEAAARTSCRVCEARDAAASKSN